MTAARLCPATVRLTPACLQVTREAAGDKDKVVYSRKRGPRREPMGSDDGDAKREMQMGENCLLGRRPLLFLFPLVCSRKARGFALEVTNRKERGLVNGRLVFPSGLKSGVEAYNCVVTNTPAMDCSACRLPANSGVEEGLKMFTNMGRSGEEDG